MKITMLKNVISGKTRKALLSFILTLALSVGMLTGLSTSAWAAENSTVITTDKTITNTSTQGSVYVALGDSVPAGYALTDAKDCCVQQFSDKMAESGYPNTSFNYAVSGITTGTLLSELQNIVSSNPDALKTIQAAGVITLNIGGNNVLGPFVNAVNEKLEQQIKALGINSIAEATSSQLVSIGVSLYTMSLDEAQIAQIKEGTQGFAEDFPKIIEWLKTNAPGANIIVSTIYNPIPSYLSFYNLAGTMLAEMNTVITNGSKQSGYSVADIYTAFAKEQAKGTQILNLNLAQNDSPISIDIHPNTAGHALIAQIHKDIFQTLTSIVRTDSNSPVTTFISLSGKVKKGALSASITEQSLKAVIDKAQTEVKRLGRESDGIAVIFNNASSGIKSMNVKFDDAAIDLLKSSSVKQITVNTKILRFSFDNKAIIDMAKNTEGNVTVTATPVSKLSVAAKKLIASRPVFKISVKDAKGKTLTDFGKGKMTLSIGYTAAAKEKSSYLHAIAINSKGQPTLLTGSIYSDGWVSYTGNLLTSYGVGYSK